ncbi:hypothetical protein Acr_17g0008040 [Actinidia rufa]|uniref:RNase H type-1 domain-containing protein n=1 Tax=Actinidia rufa TaxID=165716 RepID=A0A7J0G381_9ERIC|nr:hypothetical protein Acr_17g0008040 [Actinidia rufa]
MNENNARLIQQLTTNNPPPPTVPIPPEVERYKVRKKNASHLFIVHKKDGESLKDYVKRFNPSVLEVEDASDKVVVMAMMEGLCPEELDEAKRRRRGREDYKIKEPDSKRADYRDEVKNRSYRDVKKRTNDRHLCMPLRRPDLEDAQVRLVKDVLGALVGELRKMFIISPHLQLELTYLSPSPKTTKKAFTFSMMMPWSSLLPLHILRRDKLHPFHSPLVGFEGNAPFRWIKLLVTWGIEPYQTIVWQDFTVVDCLSPYNAILGCPTMEGINAITSTYHLIMKFRISTWVEESEITFQQLKEYVRLPPLLMVLAIGEELITYLSISPTALRVESLGAFRDSQLVVNQVQDDYLAKDLRMMAYVDEVKTMATKIQNVRISQIPKKENKKADALANLVSTFDLISDRSISLELLPNPSIEVAKPIYQAASDLTWIGDIIAYLRDGTLPSDML